VHERYGYAQIRVERASWSRVSKSLSDANVFGLWRGEIGWYADEGALMTVGATVPASIDGVISAVAFELEATVRPVDTTPPAQDGIYAHRWFEVQPDAVEEFIELSTGAWPDFEGAHDGTRVIGLWRRVDGSLPSAHLLLVTRYASLAMWEQSRPYNPSPTPGTESARERFMRRAELTLRTGVRVGRLLGA
jgi:hypothetical protein